MKSTMFLFCLGAALSSLACAAEPATSDPDSTQAPSSEATMPAPRATIDAIGQPIESTFSPVLSISCGSTVYHGMDGTCYKQCTHTLTDSQSGMIIHQALVAHDANCNVAGPSE